MSAEAAGRAAHPDAGEALWVAIANRGEAALRFVEMAAGHPECHGRPVRSIALFTDVDANAPFVRRADKAIHLGPVRTTDPANGQRSLAYLVHELILDAAASAGAEAVWPGWGFVSEDPAFAEACRQRGLTFVGPSPETMRRLGDKVAAKRVAETAGVPVVPWSGGPVETEEGALAWGEEIGYPLVVKASAGGGGRGIRIVECRDDLGQAFQEAQREGREYFGDAAVFLEHAVGDGRHLEAQVVADRQGNVWVAGLRDCSVQRRRQKVLEESLGAPPDLVEKLSEHARTLCQEVGYLGAGTVEFLHDTRSGQSYFMEVNARLQVEHPVTEATTGLDLVHEQLRVVLGGTLDGTPVQPRGHAIEVRLNAEDPDRDFAPAPGRVLLARWPTGPGVRVDTGVTEGYTIPSDFDSMIAKIITHGATRDEALTRMRSALRRCDVVVEGGTTNRSFMLGLLDEPILVKGQASTRWVDQLVAEGSGGRRTKAELAVVVAAYEFFAEELAAAREQFLATARRGWPELPPEGGTPLILRVLGTKLTAVVRYVAQDTYEMELDGAEPVRFGLDVVGEHERRVRVGGRSHEALVARNGPELRIEVDGVAHTVSRDEGGIVRASLGGVVVASRVSAGDDVVEGDVLVILESMKMESAVRAGESGRVAEVAVHPGAQVDAGDVLVRLDSHSEVASESSSPLDFGAWPKPAPAREHERLRSLLLGFDGTVAPPTEGTGHDDESSWTSRLEEEVRLLRLATELWRLGDRGNGQLRQGERRDTDLLLFLRAPTFVSGRVDVGFSDRLDVVLEHFGARQTDPPPVVADALLRVWRALSRSASVQAELVALLSRWRRDARKLLPHVGESTVALLAELAEATHGAMPAVADTARWVRRRFVNDPALRRHRAARRAVLDGLLATIEDEDPEEQRDDAIRSVVQESEPWQSWLPTWTLGDPESRAYLTARLLAHSLYGVEATWDPIATPGADVAAGLARRRDGAEAPRDALVVVTTCLRSMSRDQLVSLVERGRAKASGGLGQIDVAVLDPDLPDLESTCEGVLRLLDPQAAGPQLTVMHARGHDDEWASTETYEPRGSTWRRVEGTRDLHPEQAARLELWRFREFATDVLRSHRGVHAIEITARTNQRDRRTIVTTLARTVGDTVVDEAGRLIALPFVEGTLLRCLDLLRQLGDRRELGDKTANDRVIVVVEGPWDLPVEALRVVADNIAPETRGLDLEQVVLRLRRADLQDGRGRRDVVAHLSIPGPSGIQIGAKPASNEPVRPLDRQRMLSLRLARRGLTAPHDIIRLLTSPGAAHSDFPPGTFQRLDLVGARLTSTDRPIEENDCGVVVGTVTNRTAKHPDGMTRVLVLSDPSQGLGALGEPECRRILAALDLAAELGEPIEWYAASSGARVAMDSGTENMDWTARVLAKIVDLTQAGAEINVVVTGVNVGAQSYWNAEATMLMHCRGILVMVADHAMVLTGKTALEYSGGVAAPTNAGIGGFDDVMGLNGQGQYWSESVAAAIALLFRHYERTYVAPGEASPRRRPTRDPLDRDVRESPHAVLDGSPSPFERVGDVFDLGRNPDRKLPFDIRSVMRAVHDADDVALERWAAMRDAESAVVWDVHVGGMPVTMVGIESRDTPRRSVAPVDGPRRWTGGTLFPLSSKKVARALNAASGRRPAVILANLSGFDGSPESMRRLQLEYGAEIGRAVVNFSGPIIFCVLSRYHGGAFVVFSKALNSELRALAIEGARASVLGGAPAAAVVFAREVAQDVEQDPRVAAARRALDTADAPPSARQTLADLRQEVRSEVRARFAARFDGIHSVERARDVGSIDAIVAVRDLRPRIVAELGTHFLPTSS